MGLGSGLCQLVSLPSFKRPHSTEELTPTSDLSHRLLHAYTTLGVLGPMKFSLTFLESTYVSLCLSTRRKKRLIQSDAFTTSGCQFRGCRETLRREVTGRLELENRAAVSHSEIVQFEYSKFTFIITVLVIMEQNLSQ